MSHAVFGAEARRLFAHVFDQFRTLDALGKAGKIFHQGGQRKLAARLMTFKHQWFEIGAGAVEGGRVSGTSGADDYDVANVHSDSK